MLCSLNAKRDLMQWLFVWLLVLVIKDTYGSESVIPLVRTAAMGTLVGSSPILPLNLTNIATCLSVNNIGVT